MGRTKAPAAEDIRKFHVHGRAVTVVSRPPREHRTDRWHEAERSRPAAPDTMPPRTAPARDPRDTRDTMPPHNLVVAYPDDPLNAVVPVEPITLSLPSAPDGLVLHMDERGDGHVYAIGEDRVHLGSDGMWWIVSRIVEALEDPQTIEQEPRFLTLGGHLGGPAVQAALQHDDDGICLVWRRLDSGLVGDLVSWQELSAEKAMNWLKQLYPVLADLETQRVHRHRLLPAQIAEKWATVLERRSA